MNMALVPTTTVEEDKALTPFNDAAARLSIAESFTALSAGLQQAVGKMAADDISLEVDATTDRLRVRFRAYRHRNGGGQ